MTLRTDERKEELTDDSEFLLVSLALETNQSSFLVARRSDSIRGCVRPSDPRPYVTLPLSGLLGATDAVYTVLFFG